MCACTRTLCCGDAVYPQGKGVPEKKPGQDYNGDLIVPIVEHGGGSMPTWD